MPVAYADNYGRLAGIRSSGTGGGGGDDGGGLCCDKDWILRIFTNDDVGSISHSALP